MAHALEPQAKTVAVAGGIANHGLIGDFDPRVRIVIACVFAFVTVSLSTLPALIGALAVSIGLLLMSRLPIRRTLKRMVMMDGFIIFMLVLLPFSMPGDALFTVWVSRQVGRAFGKPSKLGLTANAVILALMVSGRDDGANHLGTRIV